jgi:biotin carboxylase
VRRCRIRTRSCSVRAPSRRLDFPLVLKPRFGSWGRDVTLCRDEDELRRALEQLRFRPWLRAHGALLQELVPPVGHDLRLVVAAGRVVGAARRDAAEGEWRTNVRTATLRAPRSRSCSASPPARKRRSRRVRRAQTGSNGNPVATSRRPPAV